MSKKQSPRPSEQSANNKNKNIGGEDQNIRIISQTDSERQRALRDRRAMLEQIDALWIRGVLEKSLYNKILIEPVLEVQPSPLRQSLNRETVQTNKLAISIADITEIFDTTGKALLILGEAGSGKTTILLRLARDLITRAMKDDTEPIPVVFNLATWADSRKTIAEWLVEELVIKYNVPNRLSRSWVENSTLTMLLDGLDEVRSERRVACVQAINEFRRGFGLTGIVVTCRRDTYMALPVRLALDTAVDIKPLTSNQLDNYLLLGGTELEGLRYALLANSTLRELAQSPVMLSTMAILFRDWSAEDVVREDIASDKDWLMNLMDEYVEQSIERTSLMSGEKYDPSQIRKWLSSLAHQLRNESQVVFFLEDLQPSWVLSDQDTRSYRLGVKLVCGIACGLVFFLAGGLVGLIVGNLTSGIAGSLIGFGVGMFLGSIIGETGEKAIRLIERIEETEAKEIKLFTALTVSWPDMIDGGQIGIRSGLSYGLIGGALGGILGGLLENFERGLAIGVGIGTTYGILTSLIGGLILGLKDAPFQARKRPNQGIWMSFRSCGIVWLATLLLFGTFFSLLLSFVYDLAFGILLGLSSSFLLGLLFGLFFGGKTVIQHLTLRFVMSKSDLSPLKYTGFLEYAVNAMLLRKVGGGYIFTHHLLLDYFAGQHKTSP